MGPLADAQRPLEEGVELRADLAGGLGGPQRPRSWPRICPSPIAIESSPQATEKVCETARSSWWT